MSAHTPGPWILRTGGSVGTKSKMVASVYGDHPECHEDDRMHANARLIAAAPDLLAALQDMLSYAPDPAAFSTACVHDRARAAIAKATGEQA